MADSARGAAVRIFERFVKLGARDVQSGHEAEKCSGKDRGANREGEGKAVNANAFEKRNGHAAQVRKSARSDEGEEQSEHGTGAGEKNTLGEHLADEARLCSAKSGADGDFFLPGSAAREEEVGEIRAHDEHDDSDGTGEEDE